MRIVTNQSNYTSIRRGLRRLLVIRYCMTTLTRITTGWAEIRIWYWGVRYIWYYPIYQTASAYSCRRYCMGRSSYAASVWCKGILRGYRPHCLPISFSKGHRSALPAASIMLKQPMSSYRGQASELEIHRQETRNTKAQMVGAMQVYACTGLLTQFYRRLKFWRALSTRLKVKSRRT